MGYLDNGEWISDDDPRTNDDKGAFVRRASAFRNWVTADGSPGPSGEGGFAAEPDRYHLYVSLACPWAHRALIMRRFKRLESMIDVSVVHWLMRQDGWTFKSGPGVIPDPIQNADFLREVYVAADSNYTGKVTVPVLWDKKNGTIVSNESAEIIRMFNSAFDRVGAKAGDYYPERLRGEIDSVNDRIYDTVNNGVYKSGFATSQDAYEEAVSELFKSLDWIEDILSKQRFLVGDTLTEADIRLFTTLVRFDPVYHGHFKCNVRRVVDYPNLWNYTRDLFQRPGVSDTVNFQHIKNHYYQSHVSVNPTGIVPMGPALDYEAAHDRDRFAEAA
ncbi:glutathione S-transferase family protein [Amorphus orientalis]|uniref:Glutathione S-transferase n=1 Tax=Amorphus orientalis TaxID=649198 RepID=A0AAE3VL27_9HYPH|nr:glutathione S-transferase family protein [Amorphus orientalis]MDQ0313671.1 putative glutathione S-transferase [Amorphus orientalis]